MSKRTGKMESSRFFLCINVFDVYQNEFLIAASIGIGFLFRLLAVMNLAGTVLAIFGGMFFRSRIQILGLL